MSKVKRHRAPDTRKGDRHAPGYMAKYLREWRARKKAEKLSQSPSIPKPN